MLSTEINNPEDPCPMNFTESHHGNLILEKLNLQRQSGKFCDVILYVENKKFFLHRNILSSFSPYFEAMFESKRITKEAFSVTCNNSEIFQIFVNYMYTGNVIIDRNNVAETIQLAHKLEVVGLKLYCAQYLEKYLDLNNCLAVKDLADKCDMPLLSQQATNFIQEHNIEVFHSHQFLQLDISVLENLLSDKTLSLPQTKLFKIIINWVKEDVELREKQLKRVLTSLKWLEIDIEDLNAILEKEDFMTYSQLTLYWILTLLEENGIKFPKYESTYTMLSEKYAEVEEAKETQTTRNSTFKMKIRKRKLKKHRRLLRANPMSQLAALRSALVLRMKHNNSDKYLSKTNGIKSNDLYDYKGDNGNSPLQCHLCSHLSLDTTSLEQHLSSVHSRDVTYKCGICGFVCQWNNLYIGHIREHFPGPPYKCDLCEFTCDKLNSILTHRSSHIQDKLHKCPHCKFRSKSQANVLIHSKCHLNEYPSSDKNERFPEDTPYLCDLCGFSSKYLSNLLAHKRIHDGDVYRCSYSHCKFTTAKKSQLMSHSKSHQGIRPHSCAVCGRGFLEKSHLVRHERIHLEEKPFKCQECDYASSRRDKLKEHQTRHHGDNASAKVPYKPRPNKKSTQFQAFSEGFGDASRVLHQSNAPDISDSMVPNHLISSNFNSYSAFPGSAEGQLQHSTGSTSSVLDFHHQQLMNSPNSRMKDHSMAPVSSHKTTHQSSAAAVAAAMMLDSRLHHGNGGSSNSYSMSSVSMATMVNQTAGQVIQSGHQMGDYPTALISLF